uniref:Uncharacterized protein n=1 Tax=Physcomitrium patens TaxID=3218 RepID=A0A2K1KV63_PHYPA|nr:hypothetical protein PHYPA_004676 [Physcomitrium patens]
MTSFDEERRVRRLGSTTGRSDVDVVAVVVAVDDGDDDDEGSSLATNFFSHLLSLGIFRDELFVNGPFRPSTRAYFRRISTLASRSYKSMIPGNPTVAQFSCAIFPQVPSPETGQDSTLVFELVSNRAWPRFFTYLSH